MRRKVISLVFLAILLSLIRVGTGISTITDIDNVSHKATVKYLQKEATVRLKRNTLYEVGDEFPIHYIKLQIPFIKSISYIWGGEYFDSYN